MKHIEPMVSVAMIAYNKADVIGRAIRGVVEQHAGFGPIELIVVDDCSTDSTLAVAREWASRYPAIVKVFSNSVNLGLQRNYMEAFRHCTGRYLAICDADDYWFYRRKLQTQVEYMEANQECSITFHRVVNFYEADNSKSLSNGRQKTDTTLADLSRSNYITNLSVVYRRGLVDLANLPAWFADDRSPDYALHMLYASKGSIHYFSRPMGVYRIAAGSAWSTNESYRRLEMSLRVRDHLLETFAGRPEATGGLRAAIGNILLNMVEAAGSNLERRNFAIQRLLSDRHFSSTDEIEDELQRRKSSAPGVSPLLKRLRTIVSRFVPLPR